MPINQHFPLATNDVQSVNKTTNEADVQILQIQTMLNSSNLELGHTSKMTAVIGFTRIYRDYDDSVKKTRSMPKKIASECSSTVKTFNVVFETLSPIRIAVFYYRTAYYIRGTCFILLFIGSLLDHLEKVNPFNIAVIAEKSVAWKIGIKTKTIRNIMFNYFKNIINTNQYIWLL